MRSMTTRTTSATIGTEIPSDATMVKLKVQVDGGTTATTIGTTNQSKNGFRFPRFSLKSSNVSTSATTTTKASAPSPACHDPQTLISSSSSSNNNNDSPRKRVSSPLTISSLTPKSSRRLRNFPLLRIRGNIDASETSAMTSLMTTPVAQSSNSSLRSSSNASTSSSTATTSVGRETREDFVAARIVTIHQKFAPSSSSAAAAASSPGQDQRMEEPVRGDRQGGPQQQQQQQQSPVSSPAAALQRTEEEDLARLNSLAAAEEQQDDDYYGSDNIPYSCATAILQHSYLEMMCGTGKQELLEGEENTHHYNSPSSSPTPSPTNKRRQIPEDPTVQDSFECVFASQLEDGIALWADDDDSDDDEEDRDEHEYGLLHLSYEEAPINAPTQAELPSPAPLMQSRLKSRIPFPSIAKAMIPSKRRSHPSNNILHNGNSDSGNSCSKKNNSVHHNLRFASDSSNSERSGAASSKSPKRKRKYHTAKIVHVGTFDPRTNRILDVAETDHNLMEEDPVVRVASCLPPATPSRSMSGARCFCHSHTVPVLPAEYWPQAPLLLRPTPGTGMTIRGVRFSSKTEHFWKPSDGRWWLTPLYELAGKDPPSLPPDMPCMCPQCCLLPINNGNEPLGQALVTDFETPVFEGSLLLRLRHVEGGATATDPDYQDYDDEKGYFSGLNRRYQVVIRGKFKREIPLTGLVSGCVMDRPCGRLPPKWIMKGAVKVLSFFAPQVEVEMDGPRPKTMAPLGSTPQALIVQDIGPNDELPPLDDSLEEPTDAKNCLLQTSFPGTTSLQRARGRKKAFDKLYALESKHPMSKINSGSRETYYTFEFLQHLVNFQEFSIELGNLLGSLPIAPIMAGQPIPIMAMDKEGGHKLWSFDIWHESLVEAAKEYDANKQTAEAKQ